LRICVIGYGSWGRALAALLAKNGHSVAAWQIDAAAEIVDGIFVCGDAEQAADGADLYVYAAPSAAIGEIMEKFYRLFTPGSIIVSTAKGFEKSRHIRLSQYLAQAAPNCHIAVLTGPSHAEEVEQGLPTAILAVSDNDECAKTVQQAFSAENFRVYTSKDVIGAELGGALKNIIALAAGMCDGLGFGDNTMAALITRGLAEISRLGVAMGAQAATFAGLSGLGDLVVTCASPHSRNRRAGILLAKGRSADEAMAEIGMAVEGIHAAGIALALAREHGVNMPIVEEINKVLFDGKTVRCAVSDLMLRIQKME